MRNAEGQKGSISYFPESWIDSDAGKGRWRLSVLLPLPQCQFGLWTGWGRAGAHSRKAG